jgi:hypothetical protein
MCNSFSLFPSVIFRTNFLNDTVIPMSLICRAPLKYRLSYLRRFDRLAVASIKRRLDIDRIRIGILM